MVAKKNSTGDEGYSLDRVEMINKLNETVKVISEASENISAKRYVEAHHLVLQAFLMLELVGFKLYEKTEPNEP